MKDSTSTVESRAFIRPCVEKGASGEINRREGKINFYIGIASAIISNVFFAATADANPFAAATPHPRMSVEQVAEAPSVKLSNPEVLTPEFWAAPFTSFRPFNLVFVTFEGDLSMCIGLPYVTTYAPPRCTVSWPSYTGASCRELLPRMREMIELSERTMDTIDTLFASNKERLFAEMRAHTAEMRRACEEQREKARQERSAKRASERDGDSGAKKKKKTRTILVKKHVFPTVSEV
jgi:hypothetical protein